MPLLLNFAIGSYFATVDDPRKERTRDHALLDIIVIALAAIICGAASWVAVAEFGRLKQVWLHPFLDLPNGIPSHDTFGRVFARIDPAQFQHSFVTWVQAIQEIHGDVIAIDGKTHHRSHDQANGTAALHLVRHPEGTRGQREPSGTRSGRRGQHIQRNHGHSHALGSARSARLHGHDRCHGRSNRGGAYLLALKGNQPQLHADVVALFADARSALQPAYGMTHATSIDKGHGRIEQRQAFVISDPSVIAYRNEQNRWTGLRSVVVIERERTLNNVTTTEQRSYLASQVLDPVTANHHVRAHWGIEKSVHWVLDVTFNEDASRIRTDHAPQNMAVLRHITLNLLRQAPSRGSLTTKRFRCALSEEYLAQVLGI